MIDVVMRLASMFANMLAFSAFAFAMVIGVTGVADAGHRRTLACRGCLDAGPPAPHPLAGLPRDPRSNAAVVTWAFRL